MWTLFQPNWVRLSLSEGWGASCPGLFILPSVQDLVQAVSSVNSYCTIILEHLVVWDIKLFQSNLNVCIHFSVWLSLSEGWGASCPGWFILPPAQDLGQAVSSVNPYCTIILEYLVVWDINMGGTKYHKPPQNITNHHKPHHKQPQTTSQTTTNNPKAQINHHTHPLNKYSDPNLGKKCCGLECGVQKGYDIVKFVTANIHW